MSPAFEGVRLFTVSLTLVIASGCVPPDENVGGGSPIDNGSSESGVGPPFELEPAFVLGLDSDQGDSALLYRSNSVAIDQQGDIYVLDAGNQRVVVFDREGRMLHEFGRGGQGPGEFFLGADMGDEIVVTEDRVYVMEKQRQRVQGLTKAGDPVSSFALSEIIWKIDVHDGLVYVSMHQSARGRPTVGVFTPEGELVEYLGESTFDRNEARVDRLNWVYAAVGSDGTVRQVNQQLPLMRRLTGPDAQRDTWFDFSWWERGDLRVWVTQGNSRQAYEAIVSAPNEVDPPKRVVFWDLEYTEATDEWWVVMYNSIAQSFAGTGEPSRAFLLLPGQGESAEVRADPQDIGVDPGGEMLCAADRKESVVRCYDMPPVGGGK